MPTEIKVVIPLTHDDDVDDNHNENDHGIKNEEEEKNWQHPEMAEPDINVRNVTTNAKNNRKETFNSRTQKCPTRQLSNKRNGSNKLNTKADLKVLLHLPQQHSIHEDPLHSPQQHSIPKDQVQHYNVIRDKGQERNIAQMPTQNKMPPGPLPGDYVHVSISGTYDIDVEHHDIMVKALRAYSRHRVKDTEGSSTNNNRNLPQEQNKDNQISERTEGVKGQPKQEAAKVSGQRDADVTGSNRDFRLSQCRLRFHDDLDFMTSVPRGKGPSLTIKRKPLMTSSPSVVSAVPTLYTLEESDGIIVDSVGHVYQHKRIRPWTALPGRYVEYVRPNTSENRENYSVRASDTGRASSSCLAVNPPSRRRSTSSTAPSRHPSTVTSHHSSTVTSHHPSTVTSHQPRVVTDRMSDNAPHSMAFQRRNRTTHIWTDGSQLMSTSLPTGSFLHQHVNSSSLSSPRSSRSTASEKASPAGKSARPSSSYSYDGGFFLGAHSGHAEYFVIHPDWVSEAVTIKKLSIGSKSSTPPVSKSASFRGGNWCGRRCLSAPPAKRRNPITWDVSDPIDIPAKP